MPKWIVIPLLALSLLLAACQPAGDRATEVLQVTAAPQTAESPTAAPQPVNHQATTQAPTLTSAATPGQASAAAQTANCTVVSRSNQANPDQASLFPAVTEADWVEGPATARVTIIEYSDFQCPGCGGVAPVLAQIQKDYPEAVRIVYRHFPLLSIHDKAALATQAAEAAGLQGKFWEMHDLLFARQGEWSVLTVEQFKGWLVEQAAELDLDGDQFTKDMLSDQLMALAQNAWEDGQKIGLPGTPFLLIEGQYYGGPTDYNNLTAIVKLIQLEDRQFTECPAMAIDPLKQYTATLHTVKGDITIQLFSEIAPMAVNSFIFLARNGWFDGVTFHRVIPGFMAQAGDPTGTGFGGPGYAFDNEISPEYQFDKAGVVGMANAGPGSNGSQFFITLAPADHLNGSYTIFGQVVAGQEVVAQLAPRNPQQNPNAPPGDAINSVTITEK
jgi:cyclophilin family peptidyl-prolyl cis-trans isomerase/protein-disulfide isomerase